MRIVTNFVRFPESWKAPSGETIRALYATTAEEFSRHSGSDVVWLVNCNPRLTLQLGLRKFMPWVQAKLVVSDIVLRAPGSFRDRLVHPLKRLLLDRVDHFIHYFSDLGGYTKVFGIDPARSSCVPFKVNLPVLSRPEAEPNEGRYVVCFGRSMRDYDTFFAAVEKIPYPAAISSQEPAMLRAHGARFLRPLSELPKNLEVLEDDGSEEAQIRILRDARVVVLPILKTSMVASGISSCLNAMSLGKCVIGTEGPGMTDVFQHGEALAVPPENPDQLAAAICRVLEDDALRSRTAAAGLRYAQQAGGETELYHRILNRMMELYG